MMSPPKEFPSFSRTELPNGVRIITEQIPSVRSVAVGAWVQAGSRDETKGENGISHFIEHMVFKGTTKRRGYQINQRMESVGGYLNAFTTKEHTCFYARSLDEHLGRALDTVLDLVTHPTLPEKEVETEKDVVSDSTRNGVGNRIIGYVSLNQGLGSASVTVYGFDVFRGNPQLESTAAGAAILPRGNLLAAGFRFDFPLGRTTTVEPNVEYRVSDAAPDASTTSLERLGESLRYGVDLRIRATRRWAIVLQGGGISGYVTQSAARINFRGFRGALHLEFTP